MKPTYYISSGPLAWPDVEALLREGAPIGLSSESEQRIRQCRSYLERKLNQSDARYYGINTGFGALCDIRISPEETQQLQYNLVQSHACGAGPEAPPEIVRLMLFLKVKSLALGYSGVRLALARRLVDFYNLEILPVVFEQGSLGASGDLAPLAHFSLPLIGLGAVRHRGVKQPAAAALAAAGLTPLRLESKEGLALVNGTQFSGAYGVWCVGQAGRLLNLANLCAALSLDVFHGLRSPFDDRLQRIRPQAGQREVARAVRRWLAGSELEKVEKAQVQDPYAFRCVPQVHGASMAALAHARSVVLDEVNSVTDNPNIFPEEDAILSGGNFHAQPLALVFDYLAIALAELGSISERRTYQLLSGNRGLPVFLTQRPGLHSGLMIPQYTAAAIVSQNKQLCTPASVDSITSSNGQEDHVSMSANAATKLLRVVENLENLLAIEFMTAAQALSLRRPARTSPALEAVLSAYRKEVPPLDHDRVLSDDIRTTVAFLRRRDWQPEG